MGLGEPTRGIGVTVPLQWFSKQIQRGTDFCRQQGPVDREPDLHPVVELVVAATARHGNALIARRRSSRLVPTSSSLNFSLRWRGRARTSNLLIQSQAFCH